MTNLRALVQNQKANAISGTGINAVSGINARN